MARPFTKVRSELALTIRNHPERDVTELRRELNEARLAEYIQRTVDQAPALSAEQRDRLATLLRGTADQPLDAA